MDLCTLADVAEYVPGYDVDDPDNAEVNQALEALISSQSAEILRSTGREFVSISPALDPRSFDITEGIARRRRLPIGDITTITTVTLKRAGDTVATLTTGSYVAEPRVRLPWEPITRLRFPTVCPSPVWIACDDVVEISGVWGFPAVPADVKQACAKLAIVRYVTDITRGSRTSPFSDAVAEINLAGLYASATGVIKAFLPL